MRCPNCGYENEHGSQFCGNCGAALPPSGPAGQDPMEMRPEGQKGRKKPKTALIIIIAGIAAALLAGVIGFAVYHQFAERRRQEEIQEEQREAEQERQEEEQEAKEEQEEQEMEQTAPPQEEEDGIWTAYSSSAPASLGESYKLPVSQATATSVIDQEGHDNSAAMVLDGKDETSWQEGVDGPGIGERLTFSLDRTYEIEYLSFKLGNWRSDEFYYENHRPMTLKVVIGGQETLVDFADEKTEQWVKVDGDCEASEIQIEIVDVYQGTSSVWDDTCIAEIGIYGEDAD